MHWTPRLPKCSGNVPLVEAWANAGEKSPVEVGAWLEALAEAREASCENRTCREKRCGCVSPVMLRTRSFQAPESPLSNQHTAQPSEHELSCDKFTEIVGGCRGAHGSAETAITGLAKLSANSVPRCLQKSRTGVRVLRSTANCRQMRCQVHRSFLLHGAGRPFALSARGSRRW